MSENQKRDNLDEDKTELNTKFLEKLEETNTEPVVEETKVEEPKVEEKVEEKIVESVETEVEENIETQEVQVPKTKEKLELTTKDKLEKKKSPKPVTDISILDQFGNEEEETSKYLIDTKSSSINYEDEKEIIDYIEKQYADDDDELVDDDDENVEITVNLKPKDVQQETFEDDIGKYGIKKREIVYHGGDGITTSFKQRASSKSRLIKNIEIEDTSEIEANDVSDLNSFEQNSLYMKSIMPILNPIFTVVPLITSGLTITMTAFMNSDIYKLCKISEMANNISPEDPDYNYEMNQIFLEKRRKQIEMFYAHTFSISGYKKIPSFEEFCKIIKYPDFQQLFFAAYSASFPSKNEYSITCENCGNSFETVQTPKDLCFYLNQKINIKELGIMLDKNTTKQPDTGTNANVDMIKQFKIVKSADQVYRSHDKLPNTAIVPQFKIPNLAEYLDGLQAITEIFKDKSILNIDCSIMQENTVDDTILKSYLYIDSLLVPIIGDDENGKRSVYYTKYSDKLRILEIINNLTIDDYNQLVNNKDINILCSLQGIRHAIKPGACTQCGVDIDPIWIDSETLFFLTARPKLQNLSER